MCLIPSSVGDLLAAAAPNKRICHGMACGTQFSLGAHPGATKYKCKSDIVAYNMYAHDYSYLEDLLVEEVIRTASQVQIKETFDKGRPLMSCGATQQSIV